ncbi:MAG: YqiA/YcfP family alpha/beta fold hydrolase [Saprospiraceae bacterium]
MEKNSPDTRDTMSTILYIHGFNSDGEGWKADALRRQFPQANVLAPDLPPNPEEVIAILADIAQEAGASLLAIGTSLGGFYARYLSARFGCPTWLFNPSITPDLTLDSRGIGQFYTWTKKRPYLFKREYLAALHTLRAYADLHQNPALLRFFSYRR